MSVCVCLFVTFFFKLLNVACHGFENSCKITDPYFFAAELCPFEYKILCARFIVSQNMSVIEPSYFAY